MKTKQKILITGAHGFIGSKLLLLLQKEGHEVDGPSLDVLRFESLETQLQSKAYDTLIHLAAVSHVPTCNKDPSRAFQTNLAGTALLLEAARRYQPKVHFIFASTAQVYAPAEGRELTSNTVFSEDRKISPQNTYAQTKWQAELLLKDKAEREKLKVTILRLFNHTHYTQSNEFFLPHVYSSLSQHTSKTEMTLPVGNLELYRDLGSLSDLLDAFNKVIQKSDELDLYEVFNVCSGKPRHLGQLAESLARRLHVQVKFVTDPEKLRSGEPLSLCGSYQKLFDRTGWSPQANTEEEFLSEFLKRL